MRSACRPVSSRDPFCVGHLELDAFAGQDRDGFERMGYHLIPTSSKLSSMSLAVQQWGPVFALLGTLIVALVGFYQWKKQHSNPNRAANAAARREAYEGLWQRLEQINLDLREQRETNPELSQRLREINTYFISHSLHFDDADQLLINEYVAAMNLQRQKIFTAGDEDVASAFAATWTTIPPTLDAEINAASEQVRALRAKVKALVQRVAGST